MKAITWHGKRDVRVDSVPDPSIEESTEAIVRITSTRICGSDLISTRVLGPYTSFRSTRGRAARRCSRRRRTGRSRSS
jgi:threonine dehydrogenase-like Zn-dependent dehydrogenase